MELMSDAEGDLGSIERSHAQRERVGDRVGLPAADAPQRVLGEDLKPAALDRGVGELELDILKARQWLAELAIALRFGFVNRSESGAFRRS
jgi:hypothetical protein